MKKNQKIKCNVESCKFQNSENKECELEEIQVNNDHHCSCDEVTENKETQCASFECSQDCEYKNEKQ